MYTTRTIDTAPSFLHRWPRLVREGARESWKEGESDWAGIPAAPVGLGEPMPGRGPADTDLVDTPPGQADPGTILTPTAIDSVSTEPEDELFLLGERCAHAYMQADALHYQAMKLLAEFHRKNGWQDTGFSSTAEWLAWRIGIKAGAARERVRTALALEQLPLASQAMRRGELSFTKVVCPYCTSLR